MKKKKKPHPNSLKNLKPFPPGISAGRRPKGRRNNKTIIRDLLEMLASDIDLVDISGAEGGLANADSKYEESQKLRELLGANLAAETVSVFGNLSLRQLMHMVQIQKALRGDTSAYNAVCDREEGKPKQITEVEQKVTYLQYLDGLPPPGKDEEGEE